MKSPNSFWQTWFFLSLDLSLGVKRVFEILIRVKQNTTKKKTSGMSELLLIFFFVATLIIIVLFVWISMKSFKWLGITVKSFENVAKLCASLQMQRCVSSILWHGGCDWCNKYLFFLKTMEPSSTEGGAEEKLIKNHPSPVSAGFKKNTHYILITLFQILRVIKPILQHSYH